VSDNLPTASEALIELLEAAATGDRGAQDDLLRRYWPVIRQAVRGRKNRLGQKMAAREETQDLEQAAAIKVLGELEKHEWRGRSAFANWIRKLADFEVVDAFRHHSAKKRDAGAEEPARDDQLVRPGGRSMESKFDDQHRLSGLLEQIERLQGDYGAALLMHHMGFSHAEIGDTLGCTAEAARKLVSRGRIKLLQLVDQQDPEPPEDGGA
jgi:RNA polymerase sigma-70 factor (ECF subfamily)